MVALVLEQPLCLGLPVAAASIALGYTKLQKEWL